MWVFNGYQWTWISGSNLTLQSGIYGTRGIPSSANVPGARTVASNAIDSADNLYLFGGQTYDNGSYGSSFVIPLKQKGMLTTYGDLTDSIGLGYLALAV